MSDIIRPLEVIEAEINFYKQQTASGIIEIGKRLIEAKKQLRHGEWLPWLESKVEFSHMTATKFMRIADKYSNIKAPLNLGTEKLFILLDVPTDDRQEFLEEKHEVNGTEKSVDDMTTRELEKVIKEKKEVQEQAKQLEERLNTEIENIKELEEDIAEKDKQIEELKSNPIEKEVVPEIIKQRLKKYEQERKENQEKIFNASKLVMAIQDLNFDCNAKLLNASEKIEKEMGSMVTGMIGLYKTANGVLTKAVYNRVSATIRNLNDLLTMMSNEMNLKEVNIIDVEEYDHIR